MSTVTDKGLVKQIRDTAQSLGYTATLEPRKSQIRVFGWFRGREFRPDIVLENQGRSAIVEVSTRPVMTYDVFQVDQMRDRKDIRALICAPDSAYRRIKEGVKEYASELDVRLCALSEVGDVLKELLG